MHSEASVADKLVPISHRRSCAGTCAQEFQNCGGASGPMTVLSSHAVHDHSVALASKKPDFKWRLKFGRFPLGYHPGKQR